MAVVMSMHWAGVTPEQYDAVRDHVHWEEQAPDGAVMPSPGSTATACA